MEKHQQYFLLKFKGTAYNKDVIAVKGCLNS